LEPQLNQRIHEEQILKLLPELVQQRAAAGGRPASDAAKARTDAATVSERTAVDTTNSAVDAAWKRLGDVRKQRADEQRKVNTLSGRLSSIPQYEFGERSRVQGELAQAQRRVAALQKQEATLDRAVAEARDKHFAAQQNLKKRQAELHADNVETAATEVGRYERWIHQLWRANPLTTVTESAGGGEGFVYYGKTAETAGGIGERLIVLADLLSGEPPRRPKMTQGDLRVLAEMRLSNFIDDTDEDARKRQEAAAAQLHRLIWACIAVFSILPLLIIIVKLLFDEDTKLYYSRDYQKAIGYPGLPDDPLDPPKALAATVGRY
jgi:hypothetical protein